LRIICGISLLSTVALLRVEAAVLFRSGASSPRLLLVVSRVLAAESVIAIKASTVDRRESTAPRSA